MSTEPQIISTYVDTGKVRIIFKNRIIFGEQSMLAATAAEAAGEQGKFWQYQNALMEQRFPENGDGVVTVEKLDELARQLGLNMTQFDAGLNSSELKDKVLQDDAEGKAAGVTGTPTFFVNGTNRATGAPPFDVFKKLIDNLLQQAAANGQ